MSVKLAAAALVMPVLLGCGAADARLSGTVTVDGRPLQKGHVTFYPTDGLAAVGGAPVTDGRYQINQIGPGQRRAVVSGTPEAEVVARGGGPPTLRFAPSPNFVSPKAAGNQQVVTLLAGGQTLDFTLQNPKTPSR